MDGWILLAVAALIAAPLIFVKNAEFAGADGLAEAAISEMSPDYKPWFQSLLEPPGPETESLLFALQAAAGAGVIGYGVGFYRGRAVQRKSSEKDAD